MSTLNEQNGSVPITGKRSAMRRGRFHAFALIPACIFAFAQPSLYHTDNSKSVKHSR